MKKTEGKKTRWGLGLAIIFIIAAFFISVNVFYNKTSLAYAILCFVFLELWGVFIIACFIYEKECFVFRFIVKLFSNKIVFAYFIGITSMIFGLYVLIAFLITGYVPINEPRW